MFRMEDMFDANRTEEDIKDSLIKSINGMVTPLIIVPSLRSLNRRLHGAIRASSGPSPNSSTSSSSSPSSSPKTTQTNGSHSILRVQEKQNKCSKHVQNILEGFIHLNTVAPMIISKLIVETWWRGNIPLHLSHALLKLQASERIPLPIDDVRSLSPIEKLEISANRLKRYMSSIPAVFHDRDQFLASIREIAAAIKSQLDALSELSRAMEDQGNRHMRNRLNNRKKDFVKYSRLFSNQLKEYFRNGKYEYVLETACLIITLTNGLLLIIEPYKYT
ncbi:hypothetical protein SNEBB_008882 [Seison nebaliae]|nr:hypothetical protein SNEBB_008882 [Seison nebaliae]